MPVNFQEIRKRVIEIGESAPQREMELLARKNQALDILNFNENNTAGLQQKIQEALQFDRALRCAIPEEIPLTVRHAAPTTVQPFTLIAADGSQINFDRHAEVEYALINFGAIIARTDSSKAPEIVSESELLYGDRLYTSSGLITETDLASERDLGERNLILRLAKDIAPPVISLTDGPLELWGARNGNDTQSSEYQNKLSRYLDILHDLEKLGVMPVGYVDKPGADLVVRLLEIAVAARGELANIKNIRSLRGVRDSHLFMKLLQSGERSAVFHIQSLSAASYKNQSSLKFFYINVGVVGYPALARVEIPAWVAQDSHALDNLHATLVAQCRILENYPYPYLIHRAHEIAVVPMQEKEQIDRMFVTELRKRGVSVEGSSRKQYLKNISGRMRYRR